MLVRGSLGGFNSFTWDDYCNTPDETIRHSYCAEFDDEHNLITLQERRRRRQEDDGLSGSPERAGRELPSREELNIPAEAWAVNPRLALDPFGQAYVLMTWGIWRKRQREGVLTETGQSIDDSYIMRRWTECAAGR